MPHVSIGMPVYNGEPFLEETLDAILAQTFKDFEVVISDNASTDETQAICYDYMAKDTRIRYVRNEINLGAAKNYNRVFELDAGDYFKWAAADDLFTPDYLASCVAVLDTQPDVILCYPKTIIIDEHGHQLGPYDDDLDLRHPSGRERFRQAITRMQECNAVFGVIRSNVLGRTALIGNYLASDNVLLAELALMGQFCELPQYLFFRRHHERASSCQSVEGMQEFFDPNTKGSLCLRNWKHLAQYLVTIKRAPLNPLEKVRLSYIVWRSAITRRHRLAQESLLAGRQILYRWLTP